jgi:hypothetical protein
LINIIDGMDAARFSSPGQKGNKERAKKLTEGKKPMVLKNLKNGS